MICMRCNSESDQSESLFPIICWECNLLICYGCYFQSHANSVDSIRTIHYRECPDRNSVELV